MGFLFLILSFFPLANNRFISFIYLGLCCLIPSSTQILQDLSHIVNIFSQKLPQFQALISVTFLDTSLPSLCWGTAVHHPRISFYSSLMFSLLSLCFILQAFPKEGPLRRQIYGGLCVWKCLCPHTCGHHCICLFPSSLSSPLLPCESVNLSVLGIWRLSLVLGNFLMFNKLI